MKLNALLKGLILSVAVSASANAQLIEKTLENGIDAAILDAFKDAVSSSAIDDISSISLTDVKGALNSIKIDGANLIVDFDDEKISSLLNNKGIASWSGLSDPVLVWLANVNEEGMTVMGGDNEFEFAKALNSASNLNSYNLMFPIMDLTDMQEVSAQTILSHSDSQLVKASKRYDAKYFVAGAVEYNAETETYSVKWNAYSGEGNILGSGSLEGDLDLVTQNMSREVAKVLMMNKPQNTVSKTSADEVEAITSIQSDGSITLGPVAGGVRVLVTGIENVADYPKIQKILISYGYEADVTVLGYSSSGVIFLIPTGSSPAILDGTLTHASEFTKVSEWVYTFNRSSGAVKANPEIGSISKKSSTTVTSNLNGFGGKAFVKDTVSVTVEESLEKAAVSDNGPEVVTLK